MRILIDTQILIWHLEGDTTLSLEYRKLIANTANQIMVSIVSLWEIGIKTGIRKLSLSKPLESIFDHIERSSSFILPIRPAHILLVSKLPFHHRDPFDRLITAQALVENVPVISSDGAFHKYGVELL